MSDNHLEIPKECITSFLHVINIALKGDKNKAENTFFTIVDNTLKTTKNRETRNFFRGLKDRYYYQPLEIDCSIAYEYYEIKKYKKAFSYFVMAVIKGSDDALYNCAIMLYKGFEDVPKNELKTAKYAKIAVDRGNNSASNLYAYFLEKKVDILITLEYLNIISELYKMINNNEFNNKIEELSNSNSKSDQIELQIIREELADAFHGSERYLKK